MLSLRPDTNRGPDQGSLRTPESAETHSYMDSAKDKEHPLRCSHDETCYLGVSEDREELQALCLDQDKCFSKLQEMNFPDSRAGRTLSFSVLGPWPPPALEPWHESPFLSICFSSYPDVTPHVIYVTPSEDKKKIQFEPTQGATAPAAPAVPAKGQGRLVQGLPAPWTKRTSRAAAGVQADWGQTAAPLPNHFHPQVKEACSGSKHFPGSRGLASGLILSLFPPFLS